MNENFSQFGKIMILLGIVLIFAGTLFVIAAKFNFSKLPGDIEYSSKNFKVYFPIVSCVVISVILTFIFWLINYFRR